MKPVKRFNAAYAAQAAQYLAAFGYVVEPPKDDPAAAVVEQTRKEEADRRAARAKKLKTDRLIYREHNAGKTFRALATELGMSATAVSDAWYRQDSLWRRKAIAAWEAEAKRLEAQKADERRCELDALDYRSICARRLHEMLECLPQVIVEHPTDTKRLLWRPDFSEEEIRSPWFGTTVV